MASLLFYSRALTLINRFINNFQTKKCVTNHLIFPFVKRRRYRNIQILLYHRVNDDEDPFFPATPIRVFAKQMDYLKQNFHICSLEEAVDRMRRCDIPDNTIVITFDDGYKDNYLNAFPILKKFAIPAAIFLATDAIGSGKILWHDKVFHAFRETQRPSMQVYLTDLEMISLSTLEEKLFAQKRVLKFLRSLDSSKRMMWIENFTEQLCPEDRDYQDGLMLDWHDVKIMNQYGISFGSHTVTHQILSELSLQEAKEEIYNSKTIIEEHLGVPVRLFAYPNGTQEDFTTLSKSILREAGYMCALTTIFGPNEYEQDLFELRRGQPWEEHLPSFVTKLNWYKFDTLNRATCRTHYSDVRSVK